ncbi:MAG: 50S ribosomal protein L6 [Patescibacteria group bacterium]
MSKIGKKPIILPNGVDLKIDLPTGQEKLTVTVKGPKGELYRTISEGISVSVADGKVMVMPTQKDPAHTSIWGLERALIRNMILGVAEGFEETLELNGVGYKAVPKGTDLELNLGFSHPILFKTPEGITFKVEKNIIKINGINKELVGYVAAQIRKMKVPDPYKVHGVKYADEVIKVKAGKKAATA